MSSVNDRPNLYSVPVGACICGKHMWEAENEGTCVWCGHGLAHVVAEHAYQRNMEHNVGIRVSAPVDARVVPIRRARSHEWDEDSAARVALAEEARTGRFPSSTQWQRPRHGEHRPTYAQVLALFGGWGLFKLYCADIPRESVAA
jgi:hypothetical protein